MNLTLTLPESIIARLQRRARDLNVALDDLAWKLFNDGLMLKKPEYDATGNNYTEVLSTDISEEARQSNISALHAKVAEIKKRPPNPKMIVAPTKSMADVIAYWDAHPPTQEDISPDEWDGLWANFEADMKAADRADDVAEGRF